MSGSCQRLRFPSFAGLGCGGGGSGGGAPGTTTATTTSSPSSHSSSSGSNSAHSSPQHHHHQQQQHHRGSLTNRMLLSQRIRSLSKSLSRSDAPAAAPAPAYEQHRIIMLGSERVGKTSIVSQFLYDKWSPRYRRTTEDMHRGEYELADGASLTLDILDTCGAREFPAMRQLSIRYGDAFVLVYAVDAADTWTEVRALREVILAERGAQIPIVVVGNKCDAAGAERQIERADAERVCREEWRCGYVECSAKENVGIVEVFKALLKQAKISYNLSPAVRRRRLSLPVIAPQQQSQQQATAAATAKQAKYSMKRHSCTVA